MELIEKYVRLYQDEFLKRIVLFERRCFTKNGVNRKICKIASGQICTIKMKNNLKRIVLFERRCFTKKLIL